MAKPRRTRSGRWELCVQHKLLPERFYVTFDNEEDALDFERRAKALLARGIVPEALVRREEKPTPAHWLRNVLQDWIDTGRPAKTDVPVLQLLIAEVGDKDVGKLDYAWVERWIDGLKRERNLKPGTIRKRIGSLSRALDWFGRRETGGAFVNPLKLLPRGAATYTELDEEELRKSGKEARHDTSRDRRLLPGEYDRIMSALAGEKREGRERPLEEAGRDEMRVLFLLILHTGLRLREAYTLRAEQVLLDEKSLRVRSSKQWRGKVKWRNVPMRRELHALLQDHIQSKGLRQGDLLLPFWDGDADTMDDVTNRLSRRFATLFSYAGCQGLTEHDLRHEATCRWYELKHPKTGAWLYRKVQISQIMGWGEGSRMPDRYASFRAEDLASPLWEDD